MHQIELKPSRVLGMLLLVMGGLIGWAMALAALPDWLQWSLSAVVLGWVVWIWRQARSVDTLRLDSDGQLQCLDDEGEWREVAVQGDSFVSTGLVVLRYQLAGQRVRTLSLFPDSASPDDLRRIRVSLRWARHTHWGTSSPGAD